MGNAETVKTVKSCYESQEDILRAIQKLHCPEGFECDLTYGNGVFWKNIGDPKLRFDVAPISDHIRKGDSTNTPLADATLNNVVFDPPFITYIKNGKDYKDGAMVMSRRFGGYYSYDELKKHYDLSLKEMSRILKNHGKVIFKCQDLIHNHKMHPTHCLVMNMAEQYGLKILDMFILVANHRMPMPQEKMSNYKQKHARIYHSYFLVFEKIKVKAKKERKEEVMFTSQDWEG
jgi:hypothetical protein